MKSFLRGILSLVIVAGTTLALWPIGQAAYGWWSQRLLQEEWQQSSRSDKSSRAAKSPTVAPGEPMKKPSHKATVSPTPSPWPATRLVIPEIGVDAVVVQGWDDAALRRGPGHDPRSALPGARGNCVIAGHRNVYGAWFARVNELWAGSEIQLRTPDETFTYRVLAVYAVADSDTSIRQSSPNSNAPPQLTLVTCTIPHSPNRIVAIAQMDQDEQ